MPQFDVASGVAPGDSDTQNPGRAAIGFDGTNYVVVTCGQLASFHGLFGVVVSASGTVSKSFPISVQPCPSASAVAFDGIHFLAAFEQGGQIYGKRFTPSGTVLDPPGGFVISTAADGSTNFGPSVAFDGVNYLVVWEKFTSDYNIAGARVSPGGKVLDQIPVFTAPGEQVEPALAFDGTCYLVVFRDDRTGSVPFGDANISALRVAPSGIVLDTAAIPVSTAPGIQGEPHIVFGAGRFFAVWSDQRGGIYGARINPDGTLVDGPPGTGGIAINAVAPPLTPGVDARVAFDGKDYFVTWSVQSFPVSDSMGIFGARISTTGLLLDGPDGGIPISGMPCPDCLLVYPNLLFRSGRGLIVWTNNDELGGSTKAIVGEIVKSPPFFVSSADQPVRVGGSFTLTGSNFTAGSVVNFFIATAGGPINVGPLTPSVRGPNQLTVPIAAGVTQGEGFVALQVVNTDQKFAASNVFGALLQGAATAGLPSISAINGMKIARDSTDPGVGLANVETVVPQATHVKISGTGFDVHSGVAVDVFCDCPDGKVGPFFVNPGDPGFTSSSIAFTLPLLGPNLPATGPGSFRVDNNGGKGAFTQQSAAVSAVIGTSIYLSGISQTGPTISVSGGGFSTASVINLFNTQPHGVVNLGGLRAGKPKIPLTFINPGLFSFTRPTGAVAGSSYVQVLNPPFVPFSSSGNDINGTFLLK